MGKRTGKEPSADQHFLERITHALNLFPHELAKELGVDKKDIMDMMTEQRTHTVEIDREQVWYELSQYVSRQIGYLMAVRLELDKALQKDRTARMLRVQRFKSFHGIDKNNK